MKVARLPIPTDGAHSPQVRGLMNDMEAVALGGHEQLEQWFGHSLSPDERMIAGKALLKAFFGLREAWYADAQAEGREMRERYDVTQSGVVPCYDVTLPESW